MKLPKDLRALILSSPKPIEELTAFDHTAVVWSCSGGHRWNTSVANYHGGTRCPYCAGQRPVVGESDLKSTHPAVAAELVEESRRAEALMAGSNFNALWCCAVCGGLYRKPVQKRTREKNPCPYCSHRRLLEGFNDLQTLHPELALQLDGAQDGGQLLVKGSLVLKLRCKVCSKGYSKELAKVLTQATPCPACSGRILVTGATDLASFSRVLSSELLAEDPRKLHRYSNKNVEWRCSACLKSWFNSPAKRARHGRGCPHCSSSSGELQLQRFLEGEGLKFRTHDRILIAPKELDIVIEATDFAIEFNGLYWHSDEFVLKNHGLTGEEFHRRKLEACADAGIRLLTVWEDDLLLRCDQVYGAIAEALAGRPVAPILMQLSKKFGRIG